MSTFDGPQVVHITNVMLPHHHTAFVGRDGASIRELAPKTLLPLLCKVNGEYVLPEEWDSPLSHLDHALFVVVPQGGGGNSNPLVVLMAVATAAVGFYLGDPYLMAAGAAMLLSGLLPMPNTVPLIGTNQESPSPTYNITLSGNTARLSQALPVPYGRHIIVPDFAAQPYSEYVGNDQYYHAILCLGVQERHIIEQITIDDTKIDHFTDVEMQLIGPPYPGVSLSLVDPCVVNAPEVANQDLLKDTYVGPFSVCGPTWRATKIGIDVLLPKGLFLADNSGNLQTKSLTFVAEVRRLNDSGVPTGDWILLGQETISDHTNAQIRRTFSYVVQAGRYEVRMTRSDVRDDSARSGHDVQWSGLRGYLDTVPELCPDAVFLALKIKASNQLSGLSQRKVAVIQRRMLRTWNPNTGWSDYTDTNSIAWAMCDVLKSTVYGPGIDDSRLDLQTYYELDKLWKERGDSFNGLFDQRTTVWEALRSIAMCGRAIPLMRGSMFTVVRDSEQTLPTAMFGMRNIVRGSFSVDYIMVTENDPDGIELEFFNEDSWTNDYVTVPIPGVTESVSPAKISIVGITNREQALREANHYVLDSYYRRCQVTFTTEMEGFLPSFGDLVAVSHDVAGWGSSGEIESWNAPEAVCSEEVVIGTGAYYALLTDAQGDVHGPYRIENGFSERSIRFIDPVDIDVYTGTEQLRTRYVFGPSLNLTKYCKVVQITPKDSSLVEIRGTVDRAEVHDDTISTPGGGTGGGGAGGGAVPGSRVARYAPDGVPTYSQASDQQQNQYGFYTNPTGYVGPNNEPGYVYG